MKRCNSKTPMAVMRLRYAPVFVPLYACRLQGETLPPRCFGASLLLSCQRWTHLTTELTLTRKCSAASCRDAPPSTASITRSRRSLEHDFGIYASTPSYGESMLIDSLISNNFGISPI